ncbi:MAG: glycosyltransferase [Candidatus Dojkabacteria bacterium]
MVTVKIQGPFITNYSLARVNRGLAIALSKLPNLKVYLYNDLAKLDKIPEESDFKIYPEVKDLWIKDDIETDFVIYNDFPKEGFTEHGFKDLKGKVKILYTAWEESTYPKEWVKEINENLHAFMAASTFTKDILQNSGVKVPMQTVLNAIDNNFFSAASQTFNLKTSKNFKFIHISTGRMRKGVDVLIKTYFSNFTKDDDVCLVLKSFPGPDNIVNEIISENKTENSPEIEHIFNPDLTDAELKSLVEQCDVSVYPSRAEGFGLTIAESMYIGKPVIATNYSAYLDFTNNENAYLINYKLENTIRSEHVNLGAKWAEPDQKDLGRKMRELFETLSENVREYKAIKPQNKIKNFSTVKEKINKAKEVASELNWANSAKQVVKFTSKIEKITTLKKESIGMMTFLNGEDGVSEYVRDLFGLIEGAFKNFYYFSNKDIHDRVYEDADNVIRCWESGTTDFSELLKKIDELKISIFHIQYHSGINFPPSALDTLIQELQKRKIKIYLTLHAVKGSSFDLSKELKNLKQARIVFTQNQSDVEMLKNLGINAKIFVHPRHVFRKIDKKSLRKELNIEENNPIIATHGLMNSSKTDLLSVAKAVLKLKEKYPNILYLSINAVSSNNSSSITALEDLERFIDANDLQNNFISVKEFLKIDYINVLLQACDVAILPYFEAGESGSGAIGKYLGSHVPSIVTDIKMFTEFNKEVYKIPSTDPDLIAEAIEKIIVDSELRNNLVMAGDKYIASVSFERMSLKYLELICN